MDIKRIENNVDHTLSFLQSSATMITQLSDICSGSGLHFYYYSRLNNEPFKDVFKQMIKSVGIIHACKICFLYLRVHSNK